VLSLGSRKGRTSLIGYAHRIAWELEHGPVPEGLTLDHRCRVRHCVNPSHLEPVSHQVNCQRRSPARIEQFLLPRGAGTGPLGALAGDALRGDSGVSDGQRLKGHGRGGGRDGRSSVRLSEGPARGGAVAEHRTRARLEAPLLLNEAVALVGSSTALAGLEDTHALALAGEALGRVGNDDSRTSRATTHGSHSQHQHERSHGRENSSHAEVRQ
jgi:hypothetical protein